MTDWIAVRTSAEDGGYEEGSLNRSIKAKQKQYEEKGAESVSLWITMAGPNSSVVDPTELVEIATVGVVKIVN